MDAVREALVEARAQRGARHEDQLGRPPLAAPVAWRRRRANEHRGVRGLLLRRLRRRRLRRRWRRRMKPLVELMNRTDRVRITGPGTELTFSNKGIPAVELLRRPQHPRRRVLHLPGEGQRQRHDPVQRRDALPRHGLQQHPARRSRTARSSTPTADSPTRTRRSSTRSSTPTRAPATSASGRLAFNPYITAADEGHPLRREDRRQLPPHARPGVRGGRQRQQEPDPLGHGHDPGRRTTAAARSTSTTSWCGRTGCS